MSIPIGLLVVCGVIYLVWRAKNNKKACSARRTALNHRTSIDRSEWYRQYMLPEGLDRSVSLDVCGMLANCLACDETAFRPTDRFDGILSFPGHAFLGILDDDDEMYVFWNSTLPDYLGVPPETLDFSTTQTIADLIRECERSLK